MQSAAPFAVRKLRDAGKACESATCGPARGSSQPRQTRHVAPSGAPTSNPGPVGKPTRASGPPPRLPAHIQHPRTCKFSQWPESTLSRATRVDVCFFFFRKTADPPSAALETRKLKLPMPTTRLRRCQQMCRIRKEKKFAPRTSTFHDRNAAKVDDNDVNGEQPAERVGRERETSEGPEKRRGRYTNEEGRESAQERWKEGEREARQSGGRFCRLGWARRPCEGGT